MRSQLSSVVAGIALAVTSALALAQDTGSTAGEEAAGPPLYQVEIIVFAYRDFDPTEEHFDHELVAPPPPVDALPREIPQFDDLSLLGPGLEPGRNAAPSTTDVPATELARDPTRPSPDGATQPLPDEASPADAFRFRLLRPEEYQLDAAYQKLERLSAYVPLVHGGWVQPGLPDETARPFDLALLGTANPSGTVRIYLSRFLHIELDLTYRSGTAAAQQPVELDAPVDLQELKLSPRFTLIQQRQARSGELHYFDHPAFGVLVMITPAQTAPPDAATPPKPAA